MRSYGIASGSTGNFVDTENFLGALDLVPALERRGWRPFFSPPEDLIVTRAPGRLDVMGGIADYSGSLVLQLPIANAVHVALQRNAGQTIRILSLPEVSGEARLFEMDLEQFLSAQGPIDYSEARERFRADENDHWAAYVAGAFLVLMREKGVTLNRAANILIKSRVPEGKGVSSSAALEVAVMKALVSAFEIEVSARELAMLCQRVENLVAGAPCGVMDQMTAACGEAGRLLELLCQPCDLKGSLALPDELELWGVDSGIRHSVGGSDYVTVRTAAFMGYRIIAESAGLRISTGDCAGKVRIADTKWKGYLANLTPDEYEREFAASIAEVMRGEEFLRRYDGITDEATPVRPEIEYPVRQATQHPIHEHSRVQRFARILRNWKNIDQAPLLGELLFESHQSYSNCGLGSERTDLLVSLVRDSLDEGLFGARITGGGSGGTVAVLGRRGANRAIAEVARRFYDSTGHDPLIVSGSSSGACAFNYLRLTSAENRTAGFSPASGRSNHE